MGNCIGAHQVDSHGNITPPTSKTSRSEDMSRTGFRRSYVVKKEKKRGLPMDRTVLGGRDGGVLGQSNHQGTITVDQRRMPWPPPCPGGRIVKPNMRRYTYDELKMATRNFRPDTILGEGGFGRVFKGWVDPDTYKPSKVGVGIPVAVKKSNPDSLQGIEEWQAEVNLLGKFSHPNLVKLIGHCWEEKEYLLVYEYMEKGSLENHLFKKAAEPLTWETRLNIAIGAARGLDFLHTTEKSVIYRDFKSSNVLLDGNYNAKLSDFGIAKVGPVHGRSHVTTRVLGTYGYAAPEYIATGHLYLKSDVYGFGVVLLEILTGLRAVDNNRPSGEHVLVEWVKPFLTEKKKIKKLMDPGLGGQYPMRGGVQLARLILQCLESDPKKRPSMKEILDCLEKIIEIKEKPKDSKASSAVRQTSEPDRARHRAAHKHRPSSYHHSNSNSSSNSNQSKTRHYR